LKTAGVEFIAIDNKPFYDATAPVRAKYGAQHADLIKRIEAVKQAPPPRDEAHRPHPP
jgi:TRAP-type C4-dicarboxylate transport system substrate-binding protein